MDSYAFSESGNANRHLAYCIVKEAFGCDTKKELLNYRQTAIFTKAADNL
jgi:hypothetical protein